MEIRSRVLALARFQYEFWFLDTRKDKEYVLDSVMFLDYEKISSAMATLFKQDVSVPGTVEVLTFAASTAIPLKCQWTCPCQISRALCCPVRHSIWSFRFPERFQSGRVRLKDRSKQV
jgi:hypothetical protein